MFREATAMLEHLYLTERAAEKLTTLRREARTAHALRSARGGDRRPAEPRPAALVDAPVNPEPLLRDAAVP